VLIQSVGEWKSGQTNQNDKAMLLAILAVSAVTVKLSNLAFCAVTMVFVPLYAWKAHASRVVVRITALSAIMILVW
jgi:hypothetical protein